jgi:hypothetical protein
MKKRKLRRRNPVARAVRRLRPQVVPSAKAYRRRPKHKRPFRNPSEWPFSFFMSKFWSYSAASFCFLMISMISAAAAGMLVPGP